MIMGMTKILDIIHKPRSKIHNVLETGSASISSRNVEIRYLLRWVCWKEAASISGHGMKSRRSTHTHNISSHIQEIIELQYN
jgi:hypothetical protein